MIFYDLFGKEHRKDLEYKKYKKEENSRSKLANSLFLKIKEIYPAYDILEEFPCVGLKPMLYLDFLVLGAGIRIAFEADGGQHSKFTPFFHNDRRGFAKAKLNDLQKELWLKNNSIKLVRVISETDIENLVIKINESYNKSNE